MRLAHRPNLALDMVPAAAAARLVTQLDDIRVITDRNAAGVKQTRGGTVDLLRQAETLTGIMDGAAGSTGGANGRARQR